MSVRANERTEGQLEVHRLARNHAKYVLQITSNEKVFKPEYKENLTNRIIILAIDIHTDLWTANNVKVSTHEDYEIRRKYQNIACAKCNSLLALIDLAKSVFHLDSKRIKYWAGQVVSIRNLARSWIQSDAKRYESYR